MTRIDDHLVEAAVGEIEPQRVADLEASPAAPATAGPPPARAGVAIIPSM